MVDADRLPVGVVQLDRVGRITAMNATARGLLGDLGDLRDCVAPDERDRLTGHIEHVLSTDEDQRTHLELIVGDVPMLLSSSRRGSDRVVSAMTDITSLHRRMQELEQRSFSDALTGLANRGLFMRLLAQTLGGAERAKSRTAVLFIDVDNFKAVNDTRGHAFGDAVLVEIARRLRRAVRPADLVARVGGDEFVVLAADVSDEDASVLAQRVLALSSAPVAIGGPAMSISVSVGVSVEDPGSHAESSVGRADRAMYAAKAAGRGMVVTWTPQLVDERASDSSDVAALEASNRDLRTRYEQLRYEARRDARTGLLRDDAFEDHLASLAAAGVECTVAFVDVDLFHRYNETYTHIAGHRALAAVASALQTTVGVSGSVFRYGGEEFTVVVPRTEASMQEAEELADRLRVEVSALDLAHGASPNGHVTVSVGVAHTERAADVTAAADEAMLEAKRSGRNTTRVHDGRRGPSS